MLSGAMWTGQQSHMWQPSRPYEAANATLLLDWGLVPIRLSTADLDFGMCCE